jgi:hypothetical protein
LAGGGDRVDPVAAVLAGSDGLSWVMKMTTTVPPDSLERRVVAEGHGNGERRRRTRTGSGEEGRERRGQARVRLGGLQASSYPPTAPCSSVVSIIGRRRTIRAVRALTRRRRRGMTQVGRAAKCCALLDPVHSRLLLAFRFLFFCFSFIPSVMQNVGSQT